MPIEQVNNALARASDTQRMFQKSASDLSVQGKLGAWRLVPGGSMQRLRLQVPIAEGTVCWQGEGDSGQSLAGVELHLEVALKFLTRDQQELLCFDFSQFKDTVSLLDVTGPACFNRIQLTVLGQAIAESLCAHPEQLSHVLATVDISGKAGSWLAISQKTWCYAETRAGKACLAIFCLTNGRENDQYQPNIPPALMAYDQPTLAFSYQTMLGDGLATALSSLFQPRARFKYDGRTNVSLLAPVKLPVLHRGAKDFYPEIKSMVFSPGDNVLKGHVALDITTKFIWSITINSDSDIALPFIFDKNTGQCQFQSDTAPDVRYDFDVPAVIKPFLKFIVNFFIDRNQVISNQIASAAARKLQSFNRPFGIPVQWAGGGAQPIESARFNGGITFVMAKL
jgi:hypothetical protein